MISKKNSVWLQTSMRYVYNMIIKPRNVQVHSHNDLIKIIDQSLIEMIYRKKTMHCYIQACDVSRKHHQTPVMYRCITSHLIKSDREGLEALPLHPRHY